MHRRRTIATLALATTSAVSLGVSSAQELVFSTGFSGSGPLPLVLIANLGQHLSGNTPIYIDPVEPFALNPHGFTLLGPTMAAVGVLPCNRCNTSVAVIDLVNATVVASFNPGGPSDTAYSGYGTLAINPAGTHLFLAAGAFPLGANSGTLWVVPTPLSSLSVASDILTLPGAFGTAQTHAVAFDHASGRAYVAHSTGITAIDPPYTSATVVFTIALPAITDPNGTYGRSVELSPDASTLLTTTGGGAPGLDLVTIIHAPFSVTSGHEDLVVENALALRAVAFTPDGSQALVADSGGIGGQAFAISAPYSASSSVEYLLLPSSPNLGGFEDIEISPNGQIAALSGGCPGDGCPLVVLHAPFTAAGFSIETMNVPSQPYPYSAVGRGTGTAHFWPEPITPLPQISIDRISVTEGDAGTTPATFTVSLSNATTQTVSIDYATEDSTAQAGSDYEAASGTLSFAPGQTRRTIDVSVIGDALSESDEQFRMTLSNPVNATLLYSDRSADGVCFITDDDSGNPYIATGSPLPDAYTGVAYAQQFSLANYAGTPTWTVADPNLNLPPGLSMEAAGVLGGVPEVAGSFYFYVEVVGVQLSREYEYHLTVRDDRIFADDFELRP